MFLTIKKIPKNYWSSKKPLNINPKALTVFYLTFGLTIFGLGEGLLIVSYSGASPWSVLAQGISLNINLSIGKEKSALYFYLFHIYIYTHRRKYNTTGLLENTYNNNEPKKN